MESVSIEAKPPWGGYGTFWNLISQLHEHGDPLPARLDRSVMGSRGGSTRAELYVALRFLGLMDNDKKPTDALRALARDPSKAQVKAIVERSYAPLLALDLGSATPGMVDGKLAEMGATPSTVQRARAFFLHAAEASGIPVGKPLKARSSGGTASPRRRASKAKAGKGAAEEKQVVNGSPQGDLPALVKAMVGKLPKESEGWTEEQARQWLSLAAPAIAYDYGLDLAKLTEQRGGS